MRDLIRHLSLAACLLLIFSAAWAGVNHYSFSQSIGGYSGISGTQILASGQDDAVSELTDIGFVFKYNGTEFTQFSASSNGFIRLGKKPYWFHYTPISSAISNTICAAARDGRTNGNVVFTTTGSHPNRVAVIQYNKYQLTTSGSYNLLDFQIRLYQTSNVVEIVYGGTSSVSLGSDYNLQVGLRGSIDGSDFSNRTGNNWNGTTAGTVSSATKRFYRGLLVSYLPAAGQTYRWTPPNLEFNPGSVTRYLAVNTMKDVKATLTNNSNSSATITSISTSPGWLWHSLTPQTIPAGSTIDIDLTLNASGMAAGTHSTTLTMQTSLGEVKFLVSMKVLTSTVPESPRHIAQWEPARGAIITYTTGVNPLGIPDNMIQDLFAHHEELFVVVSSGNTTAARNHFQSIGINPNDVTWITAPTETYWIRDYGPISIYHGADGSRELGIVDFSYNRPRSNDNAVNAAICNALNIQRFLLEASVTGGNVLTDGHCMEFGDQWVYLQNDTDPDTGNGTGTNADPYDYRYTLTEFLDLLQIFRGELNNAEFHMWPDPISDYIHHIDCWAKLLSPTTMLIADGMGGATEAALDDIALEIASITNCQNQNFNVVRVNCPNDEPYANAYILNNRVYVPFMGNSINDQAALTTY